MQADLFDRQFPLNIMDANAYRFKDSFIDWLPENLHIFAKFAKEALYIKRTMRREHYAIRTIGEWVRHNTIVKEHSEEGFKINNNSFKDISVLLMLAYPELDGFFETRERNLK